MPDQKYGPEIINDAILIIIINNNQLINSYYVNLLPWLARDSLVLLTVSHEIVSFWAVRIRSKHAVYMR